jgi:hypothetical protein
MGISGRFNDDMPDYIGCFATTPSELARGA